MTQLAPGTDRTALQGRTVRTLATSQVLGGVGMASGIAVGVLLGAELSGVESLAGFATTAQVLGAALIAIPIARAMASRGRRAGLLLGYALAFVGAATVVVAAMLHSFPTMLAGMLLFGGGTSAGGQARFAAADLASDEHKGRDLSLVVWATTVGSVLGPNLIGPGARLGRALGIPELAGSFVFSLVGFALAATAVWRFLRPDPLLVARSLAREPASGERADHDGSIGRGVRVVQANAKALGGIVTIALGHMVMVGVMVMTPLQMKHGHATLQVIGLVISIHILGMYVLSPLVGTAVDRFGTPRVALAGAVVLLTACGLAATSSPGHSLVLTVGLFLLGVGWSGTFVSGSTALVRAVRPAERPAVQGLSELTTGLAGATGGALGGVITEHWGYGMLAGLGGGVALVVLVLNLGLLLRRDPPRA